MNMRRLTLLLIAVLMVQQVVPTSTGLENDLVLGNNPDLAMPSLRGGAQLNTDYRFFNSRPHTAHEDDLAVTRMLSESEAKEEQLKPLSAEAYAKQQMQKNRAQQIQSDEVAIVLPDAYSEKLCKEQFFTAKAP